MKEEINFIEIDGFKAYAPELAYGSDSYPVEHFEKLFSLEKDFFWFKARNNVIADLICKYSYEPTIKQKYLEIGCGTGFVLTKISQLPSLVSVGAELHIPGLKFAKKRLPNVELIQLDATKMPFVDEFNMVGAFDVLEHIDNDRLVISQVFKSLKKNGHFFISVPQHMWLWSKQDDTAFHKRRYSRTELLSKLTAAGFEIIFSTSFVFSLLPLMYFSRIRYKKNDHYKENAKQEYDYSEFNIPGFVNLFCEKILRVDRWLIKHGISLPFGGSLLIVAKKL